jgi:pimeloyl-ACP methyl ester carboxylesterase
VGAREYDPRTARWLQRDPIDVADGHPNVYLYCFNSPLIWKDPSGVQIVIFVHGSFADPSTFDKSFISSVKQTLGAEGHVMFQWSGTADYNQMLKDAQSFCSLVQQVKAKHPLEPIYVVAHSNGGNVATAANQLGAPIDLIIRLGSPLPNPYEYGLYWAPMGAAEVYNFYDPDDLVITRWASAKGACSDPGANPLWTNIQVDAGDKSKLGLSTHSNMHSRKVWETQVAPVVGWVKFLDWREWLRAIGW